MNNVKKLQNKFASASVDMHKMVRMELNQIQFDIQFTAVRTPEDVEVVIEEVWIESVWFSPWGWDFEGVSLHKLATDHCKAVYLEYLASDKEWKEFIATREDDEDN